MACQLKLLAGCPFFDPNWYIQQFSKEPPKIENAYEHYLRKGAAEGRNPGPDFDGNWYLRQYADVAVAGQNPLIHYIEHGKAEGREIRSVISPKEARSVPEGSQHSIEVLTRSHLFDPEWYLREYPDVAAAGENPAVHYLVFGAAEGRNPGPDFDGNWYLKHHRDVAAAGLNPLLHYLETGAAEGREIQHVIRANAAETKLEARFSELKPLRTFLIPSATRRLTIVLNDETLACAGSGIQVAVIVGTFLARHMGASLRFAARAVPEISVLTDTWAANGITWAKEVEFVPTALDYSLPISENDFFLTTSWQTTRSVRSSVDASRIIYLVQDDERMGYPFGDDRLRCDEVLADPELLFMVLSEMLSEHLTTGAGAVENIRRRGVWFERAVPVQPHSSVSNSSQSRAKRNFLFDARQFSIGNLYWRGLEVIQQALEEALFKSSDWEFYFLSNSSDDLILPGDIKPRFRVNLGDTNSTDPLNNIDVSLCLADSPYLNYPILELAATGSIVVTNKRGIKASAACYSDNILYADSSINSLKRRLRDAIRLAGNDEARSTNYFHQQIARDWSAVLESPVNRIMSLAGVEAFQKC